MCMLAETAEYYGVSGKVVKLFLPIGMQFVVETLDITLPGCAGGYATMILMEGAFTPQRKINAARAGTQLERHIQID